MQVVPVIWTVPPNGTLNGRQLATPSAWPVPNLQRLPDYFIGNGLVDVVGQNTVVDPDNPAMLIGGRRQLQGPAPRPEQRGSAARRKLQQVSVAGSAPPLPPGLQGAVFRPRPGFPSARLDKPSRSVMGSAFAGRSLFGAGQEPLWSECVTSTPQVHTPATPLAVCRREGFHMSRLLSDLGCSTYWCPHQLMFYLHCNPLLHRRAWLWLKKDCLRHARHALPCMLWQL